METLDDLKGYWKGIANERVVTDRCVCRGPCFIFSMCVEPDNATNKSAVKVYNGEGVGSDLRFYLKAQYAHSHHAMNPPAFMSRGIYVELTDNADGLCIQYMPFKS